MVLVGHLGLVLRLGETSISEPKWVRVRTEALVLQTHHIGSTG